MSILRCHELSQNRLAFKLARLSKMPRRCVLSTFTNRQRGRSAAKPARALAQFAVNDADAVQFFMFGLLDLLACGGARFDTIVFAAILNYMHASINRNAYTLYICDRIIVMKIQLNH